MRIIKKRTQNVLSKKTDEKLNIEKQAEVYDRLIDEANYESNEFKTQGDVWKYCFI